MNDMKGAAPQLVALDPDDYHARHVGHLVDGRQFFATNPFVAAVRPDPGREFIAVFIFDSSGRFVEARIDDLGLRESLDPMHAKRLFDGRIAELGPITHRRIYFQPFELERFGVTFGLIARPSGDESGDDSWWVELHPGNSMAFHEPWDSGEYDT